MIRGLTCKCNVQKKTDFSSGEKTKQSTFAAFFEFYKIPTLGEDTVDVDKEEEKWRSDK